MLDYNFITIDARQLLSRHFAACNVPSCNFSFATILTWQHRYHSSFSILDCGGLVIRFVCDDGHPCYMPPLGGDTANCLKQMMADASERGDLFRISAVTPDIRDRIEALMPGTFDYEASRDSAEYIYLRSSLATLQGRHLQAKRNHVNRFCADYAGFEQHPITPDVIPQCRALYGHWHSAYMAGHPTADLSDESCSVAVAFDHFDELGLRGVCITHRGRMLAFAFGEMLTADTFLTHVEKALPDVPGAYSVINKLTAQSLPPEVVYINREEDMGLPNLRQAKMSYCPDHLLTVGTLTLKH